MTGDRPRRRSSERSLTSRTPRRSAEAELEVGPFGAGHRARPKQLSTGQTRREGPGRPGGGWAARAGQVARPPGQERPAGTERGLEGETEAHGRTRALRFWPQRRRRPRLVGGAKPWSRRLRRGHADGLRSASEPLGNLQREAGPRAGRSGGRVNREHVNAQAITALDRARGTTLRATSVARAKDPL